jgi:hypothetical protein
MKNRTLKLVACLVFQTAGWMCLFADFHGNLPIAAGCLALGNFFSFRRSYLFIGVMVALLIFVAIVRDWTFSPFPIWFGILIGLALIVTSLKEFRNWRSSLRNDQAS